MVNRGFAATVYQRDFNAKLNWSAGKTEIKNGDCPL